LDHFQIISYNYSYEHHRVAGHQHTSRVVTKPDTDAEYFTGEAQLQKSRYETSLRTHYSVTWSLKRAMVSSKVTAGYVFGPTCRGRKQRVAFQHKEHVKSSYFPNNMKGVSIHIATRGWPTKENGGAGLNYNSARNWGFQVNGVVAYSKIYHPAVKQCKCFAGNDKAPTWRFSDVTTPSILSHFGATGQCRALEKTKLNHRPTPQTKYNYSTHNLFPPISKILWLFNGTQLFFLLTSSYFSYSVLQRRLLDLTG
jgi:hypothetical protein